MLSIILATLAAVTSALPSYIAVPADQIAFLDLRELRVRRVPRQILTPPPLPHAHQPQLYNQDFQPILQQYQRQPVALATPESEAPARLARIQPQHVSQAATSGTTSQYAERPPDFGEYVDFGAHTGDHGAFGWYADYPVNNRDDSGY
ncbi:putative secreted protein [Operophtera brumata]|uniref:Putative secreted protein n=1 Tax=Operophtera brumata TaxID=104452 RepID=A0A0L7LDU4_OPEBR|nr:putative secreted protein [Operophtera brumata]